MFQNILHFPSQQNFFENGGLFWGRGDFQRFCAGCLILIVSSKTRTSRFFDSECFKNNWNFRVFKILNNRTQHWVFLLQDKTFAVEEK
jgi:hypothetical protein